MTNNCLKTKLKGKVNNNNLPLYASLVIHCDGISIGQLKCYGDSAKLISKADGTEIPISINTYVQANNLPAGDYFFVDKYKSILSGVNTTTYTSGFSFNIEDLQYYEGFDTLTEITFVNSPVITGNLDKLPSSNSIKTICIWNTDISFNLSTVLSHYPNIGKDGGIFNCYNLYNVSGNISDFAVLKYIPGILLIPQPISGDFYDAIVAWRANIESTGEISDMRCGRGAHLWSVYPTGLFTLAWTATTSSITVDGVTTTFDNSGNIIS